MIPKAELHVHLEGTISPNLARKLAKKNNLVLPNNIINDENESYISHDFLHFLKVFDTIADLIKTPSDYYDLTLDYLHSCAKENTIYVEMMYSPDHAEQATKIPSIEHLHAIQQAINEAETKWNIIGRILVTAVRHFGVESAINVANEVVRNTVPSVVGFALGGDEAGYPPELFKRAYEIATKDAGLKATAHAGEWDRAEKIIDAINILNVTRIGHGVTAINNPAVMAEIKERNVALELCPSSNIKFGIFPDLASHPFNAFLNAGILVSLNSDDPPFIPTTVGREYDIVQKAFQYSDNTMKKITRMAIKCSFADEGTKKKLLQRVN